MPREDALEKSGIGPGAFKRPKTGGRAPGTKNKKTKLAQQIAQEMGIDPVTFMLMLVDSPTVEVADVDKDGNVKLDAKGKPKLKMMAVPLDMRLDAAKAVANYIHPKLQATQITPDEVGPQVNLPTAQILADPAMSDKLSELALVVAQAEEEVVN